MRPISTILFLAANALCIAAQADALPTGGVVAAGSANFTSGTNSLVVSQNSNRAIINWNNFSVGTGNTVQFVQPGSSSAVLNRVVSNNPSQIYGQIAANGQVFLVNPNGIVVGPSGRIDASAIFLSTGNISDTDFLASNIHFDAPSGEGQIVLLGNMHSDGIIDIRACSVILGGTINTQGDITVDTGSGVLTSANAVVSSGATLSVSGYPVQGTNVTVTLFDGTTGNLATVAVASAVSSGYAHTTNRIRTWVRKLGDLFPNLFPLRRGASVRPTTEMTQEARSLPASTFPVANAQAAASISLPTRGSVATVGLANTVGLIDGAVTVRMSLVDASPIALR